MGILLMQQGKLEAGGTSTLIMKAVWDGNGSSRYKISDIAQEICGTGEKVYRDLISFPHNNEPVVKTLWEETGKPFLEEWEKEMIAKTGREMYEWISSFGTEEGEIKDPNEEYKSMLHYKGLEDAKRRIGNKYLEWEIDLDTDVHPDGLMLCTDMYAKYQWVECRAKLSTMRLFEDKNEKYKEAVRGMKEHLERLEGLISDYDRAVKRWCNKGSDGEVYLIGLAQLSLVERIVDIYAEQDDRVEDVAATARELTGYAAEQYQQDLKMATKSAVKGMVNYYYDPEVNQALSKYLDSMERPASRS